MRAGRYDGGYGATAEMCDRAKPAAGRGDVIWADTEEESGAKDRSDSLVCLK